MANDVQYLIDMLYEMIDGAKGVLMSPDKCIIVREDALDLLDELKGQLPLELKKAQDLIRARDEFVESAKKEAEKVRRQADLDAKTIVGESEITRAAREKAHEILRRAEERSKNMVNVTNEYTEDALRRTEDAIQMALDEIRESRAGSVRYPMNSSRPREPSWRPRTAKATKINSKFRNIKRKLIANILQLSSKNYI